MTQGCQNDETASPDPATQTPAGGVPRPRARTPQPALAELDYSLVDNGLDYLQSVVDHLDESKSPVTPREVKYAVLHLQAAVEVLLKARLRIEHWSLVFSKPQEATRKALDEATLTSVTTAEAIIRLANIAGVTITDKEQAALKKVGEYRNRLQHFGMKATPVLAVEAKAGEVLDFLIRFLDEELLPRLDTEEKKQAEAALQDCRWGLNRIKSFVKKRLDRLGGELKKEGVEDRTIQCPLCEQLTLVLDQTHFADEGPETTCRFCRFRFDLKALIFLCVTEFQVEPGDHNVCPRCEQMTLAWGVRLRTDPTRGVAYCFVCCSAFPTAVLAEGCGHPVETASETGLCDTCWEALMEEG